MIRNSLRIRSGLSGVELFFFSNRGYLRRGWICTSGIATLS
nr:MAG TPA: hypothetical protein [Bacteriophage sp.]